MDGQSAGTIDYDAIAQGVKAAVPPPAKLPAGHPAVKVTKPAAKPTAPSVNQFINASGTDLQAAAANPQAAAAAPPIAPASSQLTTPPPATTSGIDYDAIAGHVKQEVPTQEPGWRDRVINYLTRPAIQHNTPDDQVTYTDKLLYGDPKLGGGENVAEYYARKRIGGAASALLHPWDTAKAVVQQLPDVVGGVTGAIIGDEGIAKLKAEGYESADTIKAAKDKMTAELKDIKQKLLDDPVGTIAEFQGQGDVLHAATRSPAEIKNWVADKVATGQRAIVNTSPSSVGKIALETGAKNVEETAKAADKTQAALEKHSDNIADIRQANIEKKAEYQNKLAEKQEAANQAHQDLVDTANNATEADTQRGQLARQELELRDRIYRRLPQVQAGAKVAVDQLYDTVRKQVGNATEPMAPLVEAVGEAQDKYLGSEGSHKVFEDILNRAKSEAGTTNLYDQVARSLGAKDFASITDKGKIEAVKKIVADTNDKYEADRATEEPAEKSIDINHLMGYSSELGKAIRQGGYQMAGDVRDALRHVKNQTDAMIKHMADEYGAGSKLTRAKNYWQTYKNTFFENTGPSGSGSPVAAGIKAADSYNATQPFLDANPAESNRARQMLTGKPNGLTPHFDPNAGKLVDQLRDTIRQRKALPTEVATAKAQAKVPTEPAQVTVPEPKYKPEPAVPEPVKADVTDLTPEKIQELSKLNMLTKLVKMREVSPYRIAGVVGSGLGLVEGLARSITGAGAHPLATALSTGAITLGIALGPRIIANMMDSPKLIAELSKPTAEGLRKVMALPAEQRTGVEEMIRQLATEAEKRGKLKRPSPWLGLLGAGVAANKAQQQQTPSKPDVDQASIDEMAKQVEASKTRMQQRAEKEAAKGKNKIKSRNPLFQDQDEDEEAPQ